MRENPGEQIRLGRLIGRRSWFDERGLLVSFITFVAGALLVAAGRGIRSTATLAYFGGGTSLLLFSLAALLSSWRTMRWHKHAITLTRITR